VRKVIIAGGRDYVPTKGHTREIAKILKALRVPWDQIEIVSGGARGADAFGEKLAKNVGMQLKVFPANWEKYGRGAGHIRNKEMAKYAEILIALPGGRGTANMIETALDEFLNVYILD